MPDNTDILLAGTFDRNTSAKKKKSSGAAKKLLRDSGMSP